MSPKKKTRAPWEFQAFALKFLSVQGGAISALISTKTTDPWQWAQCVFIGAVLALGIDTGTWLMADPKKD